MPKDVPNNDFRARRRYLTNDDYALPGEIEFIPKGNIAPDTWFGIVTAPDTVMLETADDIPAAVDEAYNLPSRLLDAADRLSPDPEHGGPLHLQIVTAYENLASSRYNAVSGWYRTAGLALRTALDDVILGLYFEICKPSDLKFEDVISGEKWAPRIARMLDALHNKTGNDAFEPTAGRVRQMYHEMSAYQHRLSNFELVQSTATVYRRDIFARWLQEMRDLIELIESVTSGLESTSQ